MLIRLVSNEHQFYKYYVLKQSGQIAKIAITKLKIIFIENIRRLD